MFLYLKLDDQPFLGLMPLIHALLVLVMYVWVAAQANRFFVEARRNGALELILCSPITVPQILRGQWTALQRMFIVPAGVVLVMHIAVALLQSQLFKGTSTQVVVGLGSRNVDFALYQLISGVIGAVIFWSRRKLHRDFRAAATSGDAPPAFVVPALAGPKLPEMPSRGQAKA